MLRTLKTTFIGSGLRVVFHKLCTNAAEQPMTSVSGSESSRTPRRTKRKCTDMVLSIPGSLTFIVEAASAIVR
jgi:hypothetical protein